MPRPTPTHATLAEWIVREALPFAVASPDACDAAVDQLVAALGETVELLGFGEALHGGEEILQLRNRLFQRLVTAHGYSAIAVESSFPRGRVVNEYVAGRGPASYDAIRETGFSHGWGQLEANRELVEWMRRYNADPAHRVKLRFYGCDSPSEMIGTDSPRQLLGVALDYLAALTRDGDHTAVRARHERIESLLGADAAWENPAASMDPTQGIGLSAAATALRIETEDLITALQLQRPELVARSDREAYLEALQYALVARQMLNYHAGLARQSEGRISELLGIRDALIADNLVYAVARERDRGAVFVFAHNRHLQRSRVTWQLGPHATSWWPAGAQLDTLLGPRYAVIGSGVGVSAENGIGQPEPGTLEALLTGTPETARFIPTHRGQGLPATAIAALPTRSGSAKNSMYMPLDPASLTDFDWLAILSATTYSRGGPPLP